jgi:hypothetical protein
MTAEGEGHRPAIFIVRLDRDPLGRVTGLVERVRTGEKARVEGLVDVGPLIAAMLLNEEPEPRLPS